ncbi:ribosomal protection-like ABC-F family protein [Selenomonas montiformis]|uniref:ABC-F family ATP-binding cassette domain-containing protein n=1 Tax=Selenomonas montiformis TaxID=2652285 RepID=A0A6I2UY14_9FIRM|nr:ABC-F family ATP-binding cassette domain-containing protein [Selenomonas montiformis]MSV25299.1 ABC-F family ATP-binding cassette domain-containing protein [Selenomonas montiformis]
MSILNVSHLSHSYGGREIFEDVSFRLLKGEHVALVGANGEGKSTFLSIITGRLTPDAGTVEWAKRVKTGYLDQHTVLQPGMTIRETLRTAFDDMVKAEQEMLAAYDKMAEASPEETDRLMQEVGDIQDMLEAGSYYTIDARIDEVAGGLGLRDIGLEHKVDELSGGQRTKVLLTKLLLQNPEILILDEPTNYLDDEQVRWLQQYLADYPNAFILVSHDIPFLNAVTNVIYHVDNLHLERYTGSYEKFEEMAALKRRQEETAYERQQAEIRREQDFIQRNKARVATRGMANSRQKKLDKMEVLTKRQEKPKPHFHFQSDRTPSRFVLEAKRLVLGYDAPLTTPVDIRIERNKKIAVRGTNGLGKSTLLRTLLGMIPPVSGKIERGDFVSVGYFEQEESRGNQNTALEEFWQAYPGLSNFEVRAALASCGLTNDHITTKMTALSGGEAAKVRLAKIMQKPVNLLVLDEPTNHLDVEAKKELRRALEEYKGTLLLVSHEPDFYDGLVDSVWNIETWSCRIV